MMKLRSVERVRGGVVVSFLAMLEMVKQKLIHVEQGELFSEIRLRHKEANNVE
jgi:chromatin segregation and condensation protein Rec8/ScpA/Scc1 (kleisin family)